MTVVELLIVEGAGEHVFSPIDSAVFEVPDVGESRLSLNVSTDEGPVRMVELSFVNGRVELIELGETAKHSQRS